MGHGPAEGIERGDITRHVAVRTRCWQRESRGWLDGYCARAGPAVGCRLASSKARTAVVDRQPCLAVGGLEGSPWQQAAGTIECIRLFYAVMAE